MRVWSNERGGGGIKFLLIIASVLYIVYSVVLVSVAKSSDANLKAKTEEFVRFAGQNRDDEKIMRYKINKVAQDDNIPIKEEDFLIKEETNEWHIKYAYKRNVKLVFWTYSYDVSYDQRTTKE